MKASGLSVRLASETSETSGFVRAVCTPKRPETSGLYIDISGRTDGANRTFAKTDAPMVKGSIPIDSVLLFENLEWACFYLGKSSSGWENMKLVSKHPRASKANYCFGWNGERCSDSKDFKLLQEHLPDVVDWLYQELSS